MLETLKAQPADCAELLGLRLLPHLFEFAALLLDLLLLLSELLVGLLLLDVLVLHRIADRQTAHRAQSAAD
jgi:hypothetical protein